MRKALYILADLHDEDIIWMARNAAVRRLASGDTLISAGIAVTHLYFVIEGTLEVIVGADTRVAELGLGDVVGEMSFVEKRLPSASVRALSDAQVIAIPRETLLAGFAQDSGLGMRFYRALAVFLSDRLRATTGGTVTPELDEGVLDSLQQAGERFIRLATSPMREVIGSQQETGVQA
jgi:CRP/FNR family transcriptional regulator, cyclic AMP receptor protein